MKTILTFLLLTAGAAFAQNRPAFQWGHVVPASGGAAPTFGGEVVRGSDASGLTTFNIAVGAQAAGRGLVISIITSASSATVSSITDPRGNTYTIRQSSSALCGNGMSTMIASTIITTPLLAGDNLTVTLGSTSGTRLYEVCYVNNANAYDISTKANSCGSTSVSAPAAVSANSVQVGFVENVGATTPAYGGSAWTAVGANQSSGAVGIVTYVQTATSGAGTANPAGSFVSSVTWDSMWVSFK